MKVINFFGEEGAGKSTAAMGLAFLMKKSFYSVEYVSEFAKDVVWNGNVEALLNQNYILANQEHRLNRLKNKVEIAITDSPLLLSLLYMPDDYPRSFQNFCMDLFNSYQNLNIVIERNHCYSKLGRIRTETHSLEMRDKLYKILDEKQIPYKKFVANDNVNSEIYKYLKEQNFI